jgi:hypothetical protein
MRRLILVECAVLLLASAAAATRGGRADLAPAGLRALLVALSVLVALPATAEPPDGRAFEQLSAAAPALDREVLRLALRATTCAQRRGLIESPRTLTVIDYSLPSTERRLWVLDLARPALVYEELVAHGRGSGGRKATQFSNTPGSLESSLGLFLTLEPYAGRHGRSLRLRGLEPGVNDRALERAIVIHGAPYVSDRFAARHGRIGRSWGCPALASGTASAVIERIRGGSAVFAYYPDPGWLRSSALLGSCAR